MTPIYQKEIKGRMNFVLFKLGFYFSFLLVIFAIKPSHRVLQEGESGSSGPDFEKTRVYFLKKVNGPGCPYTASWLIHLNLYRKVTWYLDITKMEAATFSIYDKAKLKFQVADPDCYFVHHMSMFEHALHKKYGFDIAQNKTLILSRAAFDGECTNLTAGSMRNYLALIPFYGGLPPNVTKDLSVKSIGQGNSLVDAGTKALQTMATLCSCLKYFGRVVIGVTRPEDRHLIMDTISSLSPHLSARINVIQFSMHKPSHLPFHLLAWGQKYSFHYNCFQFYSKGQREHSSEQDNFKYGFQLGHVESSSIINREEYQICEPKGYAHPKGTPIHVVYSWKDDSTKNIFNPQQSASFEPLKYIYYSECDQIVKFDDITTFRALSAATNESTFFAGRRKEKNRESEPSNYMSDLDNWRECGSTGYSITWPKSHYVYHEA